MAHDLGVGVAAFQQVQQGEQCLFLGLGTGVGGMAFAVEASLVAHAEGVLVVAAGMGTHQVLVARLVGSAVARDVVVVAGEPEAGLVAGDERGDGEGAVLACRRAVDDDQVDATHFKSKKVKK